MPKAKKNYKDMKNIIIFLIIVLLVILVYIINVFLSIEEATKTQNNEISANISINPQEIKVSEDEEELNKLKEMSERNRIEYYVSQFIRDIEEKKFDEAYDVLNNDFKKNYFSSLKDFKEYSEKRFSKMLDVDYTNFERNGEIYVIWVNLTDAINGNPNEGQQVNFVVKENNFNDFELSFSVNY